MKEDRALTDRERFPLLTDAGRARLLWLREHAHAPRWNYRCGDRLDAAGLARVRAFAQAAAKGPGWSVCGKPDWLEPLVESCLRTVPIYKKTGGDPVRFEELPTYTHQDLDREPWSFVPDDAPLDGLIVYATSGTTGHPVPTLAHAETSAYYLPLIEKMLAANGKTLQGGPDRVSILTVAMQKNTFTIAAVSSYLNHAGVTKVNLSPTEWREPDDRVLFLESCNPEIVMGDPIAHAEIARLPIGIRPKALFSTGMTLLPGLRRHLEERFGCPVIDYYSTTESGPVAMKQSGKWRLLAPDLYVEIVDANGRQLEPGERGEIALTGGRNPFFPLLRYRTGDWAELLFDVDGPYMRNLEGRAPVVFRGTDGRFVNNMDVTMALQPLSLPQYRLHQRADGALDFHLRGEGFDTERILRALFDLFGAGASIAVFEEPESSDWPDKVIPYSSDAV